MTPETAKRVPVNMMESGPVGGIIAAAEISGDLGYKNVLAFDMGGTTAKVSLVQNSEPSIAQGYYIGGLASGHPVMLPVVDIIEVGTGGGSIAWIDEVGALKVGPRSAGGVPGPRVLWPRRHRADRNRRQRRARTAHAEALLGR